MTEFGAVDSYLIITFTAVLVKWCQFTQPSFKSVMYILTNNFSKINFSVLASVSVCPRYNRVSLNDRDMF